MNMHTASATHETATTGAAGTGRAYGSEWLYAVDRDLSGEQNMARDEAMAIACGTDGVPRLRFYSWQPYTLSLGHNQSDAAIDRRTIASKGYGIVRRPTGGRAVFHAEELTYAVAMPSNGDGIHATYARITEAIMRGLEFLGARDLEFSRSQPDFREHYTLEESESCFSASALNELTWHGRKLLGSAQRRYGNVLLQHGSLLVGDAHLEIIDLLYPEHDASRRAALRSRLAERTATAGDLLNGNAPAFDSLADALHDGFAATFGATLRRTNDLTTTATSTHAAEHAA
ncbi:MAG TPA: lipoate--protein ligase family protein [Candidatus Kapabacteria bacterium]|nr:lipoate--protein ligase family protein [Candidatus Kapabacteria bacterium]